MDRKEIKQALKRLAKALDLVLDVTMELDTDNETQAAAFEQLQTVQEGIFEATSQLESLE